MVRAMLLGALALVAAATMAQAKVTVTTKHYGISGKTGADLVLSMARKGPRHGFLSKAIAVTRFDPKPHGKLVHDDGVCRVKKGGFDLGITYVYPKPSGKLSPDVAKRWSVFIAGVEKHEETHGRLGRELAATLDKSVSTFAMKDKPGCARATKALTADVRKIIVAYDKKQRAFDDREHRNGGNVDRMLKRLIAAR